MSRRQPRIITGRYSRIPQSQSSSTTSELIDVSFMYQTCRCVCANSDFPPAAQLGYSVGTPQSIGNDSWIVPIYVTGSVTYPDGNNCGCSAPETFRGVVFYAVESTSCAPCVTVDSSGSQAVAIPTNVNCKGLTNMLYVSSSIIVDVH